MTTPRYVQHVSGQGEKYKLLEHNTINLDTSAFVWYVESPYKAASWLVFPRHEYHPCDPPARWVDVTGECECSESESCRLLRPDGTGRRDIIESNRGYRLRKVQLWQTKEDASICGLSKPQWAFIVEKREP